MTSIESSPSPKPAPSKWQQFLQRSLSSVILLGLFTTGLLMESKLILALCLCMLCTISSLEWFCMLAPRKTEINRVVPFITNLLLIWGCFAMLIYVQGLGDETRLSFGGWVQMYSLLLGLLMPLYLLSLMLLETRNADKGKRSIKDALTSCMAGIFTLIYPSAMLCFAFAYFMGDFSNIYLLVWRDGYDFGFRNNGPARYRQPASNGVRYFNGYNPYNGRYGSSIIRRIF